MERFSNMELMVVIDDAMVAKQVENLLLEQQQFNSPQSTFTPYDAMGEACEKALAAKYPGFSVDAGMQGVLVAKGDEQHYLPYSSNGAIAFMKALCLGQQDKLKAVRFSLDLAITQEEAEKIQEDKTAPHFLRDAVDADRNLIWP